MVPGINVPATQPVVAIAHPQPAQTAATPTQAAGTQTPVMAANSDSNASNGQPHSRRPMSSSTAKPPSDGKERDVRTAADQCSADSADNHAHAGASAPQTPVDMDVSESTARRSACTSAESNNANNSGNNSSSSTSSTRPTGRRVEETEARLQPQTTSSATDAAIANGRTGSNANAITRSTINANGSTHTNAGAAIRRTRGSQQQRRPRRPALPHPRMNALLLGISYPCVKSQMQEHDFDADILVHKQHTVEQAVECVRRGIFTEMDARDLARCIATEIEGDLNVYTVSKEVGAVYRSDRHMHGNFNARNFCRSLKNAFGSGIQFDQVILDYYWMPTGWLVTRWAKTLFQQTLPDLVKSNVLRYPTDPATPKIDGMEIGVVYLPFCAHVCKELVGGIKLLKQYYEISFMKKDELPAHSLWKGTMTIDSHTMQTRLGKRLDQEEIYCTFRPKDIMESMEDAHISKPEVMRILNAIEDYDNIRMIRLRPLAQHRPGYIGKPEQGGFIGLKFKSAKEIKKAKALAAKQKKDKKLAEDAKAKADRVLKPKLTTDATMDTGNSDAENTDGATSDTDDDDEDDDDDDIDMMDGADDTELILETDYSDMEDEDDADLMQLSHAPAKLTLFYPRPAMDVKSYNDPAVLQNHDISWHQFIKQFQCYTHAVQYKRRRTKVSSRRQMVEVDKIGVPLDQVVTYSKKNKNRKNKQLTYLSTNPRSFNSNAFRSNALSGYTNSPTHQDHELKVQLGSCRDYMMSGAFMLFRMKNQRLKSYGRDKLGERELTCFAIPDTEVWKKRTTYRAARVKQQQEADANGIDEDPTTMSAFSSFRLAIKASRGNHHVFLDSMEERNAIDEAKERIRKKELDLAPQGDGESGPPKGKSKKKPPPLKQNTVPRPLVRVARFEQIVKWIVNGYQQADDPDGAFIFAHGLVLAEHKRTIAMTAEKMEEQLEFDRTSAEAAEVITSPQDNSDGSGLHLLMDVMECYEMVELAKGRASRKTQRQQQQQKRKLEKEKEERDRNRQLQSYVKELHNLTDHERITPRMKNAAIEAQGKPKQAARQTNRVRNSKNKTVAAKAVPKGTNTTSVPSSKKKAHGKPKQSSPPDRSKEQQQQQQQLRDLYKSSKKKKSAQHPPSPAGKRQREPMSPSAKGQANADGVVKHAKRQRTSPSGSRSSGSPNQERRSSLSRSNQTTAAVSTKSHSRHRGTSHATNRHQEKAFLGGMAGVPTGINLRLHRINSFVDWISSKEKYDPSGEIRLLHHLIRADSRGQSAREKADRMEAAFQEVHSKLGVNWAGAVRARIHRQQPQQHAGQIRVLDPVCVSPSPPPNTMDGTATATKTSSPATKETFAAQPSKYHKYYGHAGNGGY